MNTDKKTRNKIGSETFNYFKTANKEISLGELYDFISANLSLSEQDKQDRHLSGDYKYKNMVRWALEFLRKSGFVENISRGVYRLTEAGRKSGYLEAEGYDNLRKGVSRENNKAKRKEAKIRKIQPELFEKANLSEEEISLLSEIVKQNNLIIEKLLNK